MLATKEAMATIAVKDMAKARKFYEGTIGLKPAQDMAGAIVYRSGISTVLVYESQYAGTNKATAATWSVGNEVEATVKALKAKGVTFEHYDLPDTTRKDDIHVAGDMKAAWFKDPDGNILAIVSE